MARSSKFPPVFSAIISIGYLCVSCLNPVKQDNHFVPWDTSFSISGIHFPNDTIFNRALISAGSNYRLHQFVNKCKTLDAVRIGFIGGSITVGAVTTKPQFRFSSRFCQAIRSSFPHLDVIELNAGIIATTSRFGCSRIKPDLLDQNPDIVFIDFAVNDFWVKDSQYICNTMEGLVRQCLFQRPDIPVVLLFFAKGEGTNVQNLQTTIGSYYSLPMISYRDAVWPLIQNGKAEWATFFHDDPHPNDAGHLVAASLMYTWFKNEVSKSTGQEIIMPAPKISDIYQYSGVFTLNDTSLSVVNSTWQSITREQGRRGFGSSYSADSLVLSTSCREVTLGIHMQPSAPSNIRIVVDNGGQDTTVSNKYPFEYTEFTRLYISDKPQPHTVKISRLDSNLFTIDYILYAR